MACTFAVLVTMMTTRFEMFVDWVTLAPVTSPAVTAGLMWQPETWPMVWQEGE